MDDVFTEAYGSSNKAWRTTVYGAWEELGVDKEGWCFFFHHVSILTFLSTDKLLNDLNQTTTKSEAPLGTESLTT